MATNIAYEKKLCHQATERELDAAQIGELEQARADVVAENARVKKAMEEVDRREASLQVEVSSLKQGKEAAEAEVLKTMEDTMVLIIQSFDLAV